MQNIHNQIWISKISILSKLNLFNTCILPIFQWDSRVLGSYQERCAEDMLSTSGVCKSS